MEKMYRHLEKGFEKLTSSGISVLGNSITFIFAFCLVIFWFSNKEFSEHDVHAKIGDIILGLTFLSLFIIQKSFNRFNASLHLKVNELISSHEPASNAVIHIEEKTEYEINELIKEYVVIEAEIEKEAETNELEN